LNLDENENELSFTAIGGAPNRINRQKGISYQIDRLFMRDSCLENPLDRDMVHALTWLPVKMFTTSVMEAAVDCWSWAIVGRPELELLVTKNIFLLNKIY
jgi:hypothetical protein